MATADERELQINPIVASSVQHNTQVGPRPRPHAHAHAYTYALHAPLPVFRLPSAVHRVLLGSPALPVQPTDSRRSRPTSVT